MKPLFILAMVFVSIQNFAQQNKPVTMVVVKDDDTNVYTTVDVPASFEESDIKTFQFWVISNVRYPEEAINNNQQGKVFVQFVVNKNGFVEQVSVLRPLVKVLDDEAIRVVASSPQWIPAKINGINVNQRFTLPILFQLDN